MKNVLFIFIALLFFSSCEKILFESDLGSTDPLTNFDYLWEEVDKKYSYFELKNIDWNAIRNQYRSQLSSNSTDEQLFEVLANMLNELRDGHTNLFSPFNVSRYDPGLELGPVNFNQRTIEEFYLPDAWLTGDFIHGFLDNNEIGYIRYESFDDDVDHFDFVLNRYKNTKGLIFDIRQNGGGDLFNIPKLLSRFANTKTLVSYSITRNGPNHNDFNNPEKFYITPYSGDKYLKPVIVLADRGSYSATTFFSLATKAFPNITLMGDTTGGGGGLPNGGQLPNGWTYRFSVTQLLDLNFENYAENGVPPDIEVAFDWSDLTKDEILERAILELQSR